MTTTSTNIALLLQPELGKALDRHVFQLCVGLYHCPDVALRAAAAESYGAGAVVRIPTEPQTVGDHIRKRRLGLKMQREVAEQIGVDKTSVFNWEANTSSPEIKYMPAIIRFLGYNPLPEAKSWGERLVRHRTELGMPQKEAAGRIGVDPGTLVRSERGGREPGGVFLGCVQRFLNAGEAARPDARCAG